LRRLGAGIPSRNRAFGLALINFNERPIVDFESLDCLPIVDLESIVAVYAELRPVFDPRLRTFSVQLWEDGCPSGIHGLGDNFRCADEPLEAIDAFLAEQGVRALTEKEAALLYAGLVRAKGGPDWVLFLMQFAARQF
jgi:hypothetical protein